MSCTAMAAMRKPNTFSVTNMRLSSSLALTWFAQRKTATSISKTNSRMAIATANTRRDVASAEIVTRPTMPTGFSRYGTASGNRALESRERSHQRSCRLLSCMLQL